MFHARCGLVLCVHNDWFRGQKGEPQFFFEAGAFWRLWRRFGVDERRGHKCPCLRGR